MSVFTAKVALTRKTGSDAAPTQELIFTPDYANGRNAEWAEATPSMTLSMHVKRALADQYGVGTKFTLTFEANEVIHPNAE